MRSARTLGRAPRFAARRAPADLSSRWTRRLLACGLLAGPLYVAAAVAQGASRAGFLLAHDDVSLLANGKWGWIQIANFAVAGALTLACAAGLRRVLRASQGSPWAAWLLAGYGAGLIAAGIFRADPANGFPRGAPAGKATTMSWHGVLHLASAGVGFLCLVAACFVLARQFSALGQRRWAVYSRVSGLLFLAGFAASASGSDSAGVVVSFWAAVLIAWAWIALIAAKALSSDLRSAAGKGPAPKPPAHELAG
jgi:hypothetical protein